MTQRITKRYDGRSFSYAFSTSAITFTYSTILLIFKSRKFIKYRFEKYTITKSIETQLEVRWFRLLRI